MERADKRKFHYIYKITRNNSDRYYIGMHSTDDLDDGYFGSGARLWKSINKYGKENHTMEILEFCESREQLKIREKEIVGNLYRLDENCMNLQPGGGSGFKDEDHMKQHGERISTALRLFYQNNPDRRKIDSRIQILATEAARSIEANNRRKKTFEERNHQQGEKNSQFGKQWIYNDTLKQCKRISKEDLIPEGWKKGRKMKFEN